MKLETIFCALLLMACSSCSNQTSADGSHSSNYRRAESFAEFIGIEVRNNQDAKLGKVRLITVDLVNARIVEVVITPDKSIAGDGAALVAVPPRALRLDESNHVLRLDVSPARFAGAPKFSSAHMESSTKRARVAEVIRYFGLKPWFYLDGQTPHKNTEILIMGHVQRTDQVLQMSIVNERGESVGRVGTLRMDLPKGHVVHVVAATGSMDTARRVIQPKALRYNSAKDGLVLDTTMAELAGEPRFRWLNGSRTSYQEEAYVNREVQADKGLHSEQNEDAGKVRNAIPMDEGATFRDRQKTARINQAIQADPYLSANAKNVEVVTLNAQTTLRGHVNTVEGKTRIGEIAKKAGRPENVSNLLEVRPLTGR